MSEELKCKKCGSELECGGGRSAHISNWYCPTCSEGRTVNIVRHTPEVQAAIEDLRAKLDKAEARVELARHDGNEWADIATNGYQHLCNVRDGLTPVAYAINAFKKEITKYREGRDAATKEHDNG